MKFSILIAVMSLWWVAPFFIAAVARYPVGTNMPSFIPFAVITATTALSCIAIAAVVKKYRAKNYWQTYIILNTAYAANVAAAMAVTIALDSIGAVAYFGGDSAGSFGMLYIPSVLFYLISGAVWRLLLKTNTINIQ
jgi:hypothetical protein